MTQNLSKVVGRLTSIGRVNELSQDQLVNRLIYHVLKKVVSKATNNGSLQNIGIADTETIVKSLGDDVYMFIKRMFIEQGIYNKLFHHFNTPFTTPE